MEAGKPYRNKIFLKESEVNIHQTGLRTIVCHKCNGMILSLVSFFQQASGDWMQKRKITADVISQSKAKPQILLMPDIAHAMEAKQWPIQIFIEKRMFNNSNNYIISQVSFKFFHLPAKPNKFTHLYPTSD